MPRYLAVKTLVKTQKNDSWLALVIDSEIKNSTLSGQDKSFYTSLVYGTFARLITLDACIKKHSSLRLRKVSPAVLNILRISVYQLLYMNVPDHSAVDEAVKLARRFKMHKSAGFVNAVLRSFLREGKAVPVPENPLCEKLSVQYSCPADLVELWLYSYGEADTVRILEKSIEAPKNYIRINTHKTDKNALKTMFFEEKTGIFFDKTLENCAVLDKKVPERDGLFYYQDKSSQIVVDALCLSRDMRVLDVCSAPGGKAILASQYLENTGEIIACELHEHRAAQITRRAEFTGCSNIKAFTKDMSVYHEELGLFDRVLCDVPCSGYGVIARKPEIKYKSLENFQNIPDTQYKILSIASQYLKAGGILVYSTCTLNPRENEEVRARFLAEFPGMEPLSLPEYLGECTHKNLTTEPAGDSFYLAAFTKRL